MDIQAIFSQRDPAQAETTRQAMERHAARRAAFIESLDLRQLTPNQAFAIHSDSDDIDEAIAFAALYLCHLAQMEDLGNRLALPRAA